MTVTRRAAALGLLTLPAATGAGCKLYSDPAPARLGGALVDKGATVMAALRASAEHGVLVEALERTGLADELESPGPWTVLAPDDAAFAGLRPKADAAQLRSDEGLVRLVLLTHQFDAVITREEIEAALPVMDGRTTALARNGQAIGFGRRGGALSALDMRDRHATFGVMDARASNGIVHALDNVLLPSSEPLAEP